MLTYYEPLIQYIMKPSNNNVASSHPKTTSKREDKKSVNRKSTGTLFFQIGLILSLLAVIFMMQVKIGYGRVEEKANTDDPFFEIPIMDFTIEKPQVEVKKVIAKVTPVVKRPPTRVLSKDFELVPDTTPDVDDTSIATTIDAPIAKPTIETTPATPAIDANASRNINQVEFVPVFPGCESLGTNEEKKACMSSKISAFISDKFRTDNFNGLSKKDVHKIYVQFKIDASGNVTEVKARAAQKDMQDEGIRVIEKLPQMTPGRMGDTNVAVSYLVPISFKVE